MTRATEDVKQDVGAQCSSSIMPLGLSRCIEAAAERSCVTQPAPFPFLWARVSVLCKRGASVKGDCANGIYSGSNIGYDSSTAATDPPHNWNFSILKVSRSLRISRLSTHNIAKMSHHSPQVSADLIWEISRMLSLFPGPWTTSERV